ncbi:uncharacterized protein LOC112681214 [Sipha flava]|uniref:Elongator complex protein 6 n=1 Tax=Sipha flava TaxID=143950 RepID=A0A8B8FA70_9HEMI|nr:uncharacterized protein LOC112681214 [Sipha flava]XP_025407262.1 uncharacterized protein LOC112681214 [Sipha flava]
MSNVNVLEELKLVLKPDLPERRMVCAEETDTSKADIILSFYMWYVFNKTDSPVCMVGIRDTYGHYQNVGLKFHYNLLLMTNKKRFTFIESVMTVGRLVECAQNLLEQHPVGNVYMIVDDISALLFLGEKLEEIIGFLMFTKRHQRLYLVFGCWKHKFDETAKRLTSAASHLADIRVSLAPLVTGFSNSATGTMRITSNESIYQIEDVSYLYKLFDNGLTLSLNSKTVR